MDDIINTEKVSDEYNFNTHKSIPLYFDESMNYYEQVCALVNKNKELCNVINNNAEVVEQLQEIINDIETEGGQKGDKGDKDDNGDKGDKGDKGDDGYTPVRGIDYMNDEDKAYIAEYCANYINEHYLSLLEVAY